MQTILSFDQESEMILNALKSGLAPLQGAQHILTGRQNIKYYLDEAISKSQDMSANESYQHIFFIADFFGNGKTVFGHYSLIQALNNNFLVAKISLNRGLGFTKLDAIYRAVTEQLFDSKSNFESSFDRILTDWIKLNTRNSIQQVIEGVIDICIGFAEGLESYYNNFLSNDILGQFRALQQLKGDRAVSVSRKNTEKMQGRLTKSNAIDYFRALDFFSKEIGFSGLFIVFDEVEAILNLINKNLRNTAYENICKFCDTIENSSISNSIIMFMLTPDLRDNLEKGIHSFRPLENYITQRFVKYNHITTLMFRELTAQDQQELAFKLKELHSRAYNWDPNYKITDLFVENFVNYFNHPLVSKYSTIRRFVRQFIDILDTASQNSEFLPSKYLSDLISNSKI
jgi:adenosylhomocysteinase